MRLIVATHPATSTSASIGKQRDGLVYELFVTQLPSPAFSPQDVLDLYLHRGSFETVLADEDVEQLPTVGVRHTPAAGIWQILSQWLWNLRLEFGPQLSPTAMRVTEFAPAHVPEPAPGASPAPEAQAAFPVVYGPAMGTHIVYRRLSRVGISWDWLLGSSVQKQALQNWERSPSQLANRGRLVYHQTSSPASSCSNDDTCRGRRSFFHMEHELSQGSTTLLKQACETTKRAAFRFSCSAERGLE